MNLSTKLYDLEMKNDLLNWKRTAGEVLGIGTPQKKENLSDCSEEFETILHISHTDLDGVTPPILHAFYISRYNRALRTHKDKAPFDGRKQKAIVSVYISPNQLDETLETLVFHCKEKLSTGIHFDKIFITDLNIKLEVFIKILNYGLEKFVIVDHHKIDFNPEELIINREKYSDWTSGMIGKHCIITSYFRNEIRIQEKKTCATELFVHCYLMKEFIKLSDELVSIGDPECYSQSDKDKLYLLSEAVRLRDTYEWKERSPVSIDRVAALRLDLFLKETDRECYLDYIADYLTYNIIDYTLLGHSFGDYYSNQISPTTNSFDIIVDLAIEKRDDYVKAKLKLVNHKIITIDSSVFTDIITEDKLPVLRKSYRHICIVFADRYGSEIGDAILRLEQDCDFVMIINGSSIELRSREDGDDDMSSIAKSLGGGGHKCAAGFPLSEDMINQLCNSIIEKCKIEEIIKIDNRI